MTLTLHHHPFTRAAGVLWMLEEVGCEYTLEHLDIMTGAQKRPEFKGVNPMGKIPTLVDGDTVVTEAAAIGLYLADRYALRRLAPPPDSPERGTYLRWSFYAPSVIEPGCLAKAAEWDFKPAQAGWGSYEEMLDTISAAIGDGPWLLGEQFTMADVMLGHTLLWATGFGMPVPSEALQSYLARCMARPAWKRVLEVDV